MISSKEEGIVNLSSRSGVADTAEKLLGILESRGVRLFARIDQRAAAKAVGLDMKPMVLLLFGNPTMGTPLMQSSRSTCL